MQYVIYLDAESQIRAQMFANRNDYDTFVAKLDPTNIMYIDGQVNPENIPEMHREVFPIFLKTMQKQWDGRKVLVAHPAPEMLPEAPEEPVAAPKPKRKRKKKAE